MSPDSQRDWPLDLRLFAIAAAVWSAYLTARALLHDPALELMTPLQAVIGGIKFYGDEARMVLLVEAGVYLAIAIGILSRRRWGLVLAIAYLAQVVMSHLIFILAYLNTRQELWHVRTAAIEGPTVVLLTLYLWIRSNPLLFGPSQRA
ncbi:MAG TPA: hypothetical protein VEJ86_05565 [Candidatus Binataceae bacterium]|nr:hypothetical protein [Candidatus Binataceae bacterium]